MERPETQAAGSPDVRKEPTNRKRKRTKSAGRSQVNGKAKKKAKVKPKAKPIVGHHVLEPLTFWLDVLHSLPTHGNRSLHADHLLVAHLVAFMSPSLQSLRHIEQVFDHPAACRRFGLPRVPKSTLSDAQTLFDPALLDPIIADLRQRIPTIEHDERLDELLNTLTAVDGTFFAMAPRVTWALYNKPNTPQRSRQKSRRGNVRVDMHFNVLTGVPEQGVVTGGRTPEYRTLENHLESGRFYVLDRAYHCYGTLAAIIAAGSDFLVRLRGDMQFEAIEEHPLSAADRTLQITTYQTVRAASGRGQRELGDTPLKLLEMMGDDGKPLRLLTNRVDLDPDLIGVTYRHRWQIELFFRWLKCVVNFRHFFSESENGVALQIGAAVIGTLLLALVIQEKPSSYDFSMMTSVMSGLLPLDHETMEILNRRRAERARAAKWQKAYNQRKKANR
jgi:hypothetical protein